MVALSSDHLKKMVFLLAPIKTGSFQQPQNTIFKNSILETPVGQNCVSALVNGLIVFTLKRQP